jgi:hypothetical protein
MQRQIFTLNGRKYRLVVGDDITARQYKALQALLKDALPLIGALLGGDDAKVTIGFTVIQELMTSLLEKGLLFQALAILLLPESEEKFNPATVDARLDDMEDLTTADMKAVISGFFSGIGNSLKDTGIVSTESQAAENLTQTASATSKKKKATSPQ